jgi:DNA-3-methyladenine glycosylase
MLKLPVSYYLSEDVVALAKNLIGKYLYTCIDENKVTGGIITETEAYEGITDKASHAYNNRRTKRTEVMYSTGGVAYVYLCYGMHALFNIVTNKKDIPHAILIRAIYPTDGLNIMLHRANKTKITKDFANGPGKVAKILGINTNHSGTKLTNTTVWLEDKGIYFNNNEIKATKRIGVDYAMEDALLPYRFILDDTLFNKLKEKKHIC